MPASYADGALHFSSAATAHPVEKVWRAVSEPGELAPGSPVASPTTS